MLPRAFSAVGVSVLSTYLTQGLNDTFIVVVIACGICAALSLFVGRDPAIQAAKRAAIAGEPVEEKQPTLIAD